ncbi:MAG TPA: LPP20 family lipoprotein [Gammaproteobacteria bacterium]
MKNRLVIFCLLLLTLPAQADRAPNWINNQGRDKGEAVLSATGTAANIELAKDRALGNLAKIFQARISDTTSRQSSTHINIALGEESHAQDHQLTQRVQVKSDVVIKGAVISEVWHDSSLQLYHALAELDRVQAKNSLYDEMLQLDEQTSVFLKQQQNAQDRLQRISYINQAIELQQQRQTLQSMLKIIDRHGLGDESRWNLAELNLLLEQQLQALSLSLSIVNRDHVDSLENTLLSAMANAGFSASSQGDYQLEAQLDVNDLGLNQGWYWQRAVLELQLKQGAQVLGSESFRFKVAALQQTELERRLLSMISKKLNDELYVTLVGFASGR